MTRIAREIIICEPKIVHKTIHSHQDRNFEHPSDKEKYIHLLFQKHSDKHSQIHAFSIMDNHAHEQYTVADQKAFSNFMRDHLGAYSRYFNKKYVRRGRVTNERPATKPILNDLHEINCVFYIHANALDMVSNLDDFFYSTHHLYAYGTRTHFTKKITLPQWYMNLGDTPDERGKNYRILFEEYLKNWHLRKLYA